MFTGSSHFISPAMVLYCNHLLSRSSPRKQQVRW